MSLQDNPKAYFAVHAWKMRNHKKRGTCDFCLSTGKSGKTQWALKRGKEYARDFDNYFELCVPCHRRYDLTEETREKMRAANIGRKRPNKQVAVRAIKGGFSRDFFSVKEAAKSLGAHHNSISNVLGGRAVTAHGYKFEKI